MNAITRHNYEEYFILYMDNELSAEERRSVEAFVQLHPDLHEELDFLLQSKLEPDTSIQYEGKEDLLFANANAISLSNYEEWLTLYIDNELQPEERLAVERFVAQHSVVADELYILQQTKLPVETIEFSNKESLYRREEKERRIGWWKIAAAAAIVVGIVGTIIIASNNKKDSKNGLAETKGTQNKTAPVIPGKTPMPQQSQDIQPKPEIADGPTKQQDQQNAVATAMTDNRVKNPQMKKEKQPLVKEDKMNFAVNKSTQLNNEEEITNASATNARPSQRYYDEYANVKQPLTESLVNTASPSVTNIQSDPSRNHKTLPDYAVVKYDDDDQQDDGKKNKFRGFLRKVTRTFEKTTNISATDDDDRLLVGGLAIRLK
jgi:hypothetical protein